MDRGKNHQPRENDFLPYRSSPILKDNDWHEGPRKADSGWRKNRARAEPNPFGIRFMRIVPSGHGRRSIQSLMNKHQLVGMSQSSVAGMAPTLSDATDQPPMQERPRTIPVDMTRRVPCVKYSLSANPMSLQLGNKSSNGQKFEPGPQSRGRIRSTILTTKRGARPSAQRQYLGWV